MSLSRQVGVGDEFDEPEELLLEDDEDLRDLRGVEGSEDSTRLLRRLGRDSEVELLLLLDSWLRVRRRLV